MGILAVVMRQGDSSALPSFSPTPATHSPTTITMSPTVSTSRPTLSPTQHPSEPPTEAPTVATPRPTLLTDAPTSLQPTKSPTRIPTAQPSSAPTKRPTPNKPKTDVAADDKPNKCANGGNESSLITESDCRHQNPDPFANVLKGTNNSKAEYICPYASDNAPLERAFTAHSVAH